MSLARIRTSALTGVDAESVDVEVSIRRGIPRFVIIGLGDNAVREAKDRVLSALKCAGYKLPDQVLVNLAPAELRKEGASYDLPIAIGILAASGYLKNVDLERCTFSGELSLDGRLKPVGGTLAQAIVASESGITDFYVPQGNVAEASVVRDVQVNGCMSLAHVACQLTGSEFDNAELSGSEYIEREVAEIPDCGSFSEVIGQEAAIRALVIAAAGNHNVLMVGTPGSGKSMLAERFPLLLADLSEQEMREVIKIHSAASLPVSSFLSGLRPYRSPHHNISPQGLIGGGTNPRPGEISLAHNGVLFLDEFPEFKRAALESMRDPLERGSVHISRARAAVQFPSTFQLIAAMNPCPCGRLGISENACLCTQNAISRYLSKISGPILDRIDLQIELRPVDLRELSKSTERTRDRDRDRALKEQVQNAQEIAAKRQGKPNAALKNNAITKHAEFCDDARRYLERYAEQKALSARSYFRIIKVARTIADLAESESIKKEHMMEALSYRALDTLQEYCG